MEIEIGEGGISDPDHFIFVCPSWLSVRLLFVWFRVGLVWPLRCWMKLTPDQFWMGTHSYKLTTNRKVYLFIYNK